MPVKEPLSPLWEVVAWPAMKRMGDVMLWMGTAKEDTCPFSFLFRKLIYEKGGGYPGDAFGAALPGTGRWLLPVYVSLIVSIARYDHLTE